MPILLVAHESSRDHRNPEGHPEHVDRLDAVTRGVWDADVPILELVAPAVDRDLLELVHARPYIGEMEAFCAAGGGGIDQDTYAVGGSFNAALHAAGAGPGAVDALAAGGAEAGFLVVRPPGHHAEHSRAMGFCLFNNVAVTAAYLRSRGQRVAIIDWDVHHGNGTQNTFYRDPDVLYVSAHEFPFYPGTGWIDEIGAGPGTGMTVNVPLPGGTPAEGYLNAFGRIVVPVVEQFSPDWILVSNGYDAHRLDPIGGMLLESEHYGWLSRWVVTQVPRARTIAFLEGGYDLDALRTSSAASVIGLSGIGQLPTWPDAVPGSASRVVELVVDRLSSTWKLH